MLTKNKKVKKSPCNNFTSMILSYSDFFVEGGFYSES